MNDFGTDYNKSIIKSIENAKWTTEDLLQKANDYLLNNYCGFSVSDKKSVSDGIECIRNAKEQLENAIRILRLI